EIEGKKVRCKSCGAVFVAKAGPPIKPAPAKAAATKPAKPPAKPATPPKPEPAKETLRFKEDEDDDGKAYGVTHEELGARCPECANAMESETAKICLHCGYNTITRQRKTTR